METKTLVWLGAFLGSTLGGYVPTLLGQDLLGAWSLVGSAAGGLLGIYAGYKLAEGG